MLLAKAIYPIFSFISIRISDISPLLEWGKKESPELPMKSAMHSFRRRQID